jgi:thiamine pyrophosphokinase
MKTLIVSGGEINVDFLLTMLKNDSFDKIIAVDHGMEAFLTIDRHPDLIVGDFDSAKESSIAYFQKIPGIELMQYPSRKDETDTELAVSVAIERGSTQIILVGAMGTRMDHTLGGIHLLGYAMERNVDCVIMDEHNRIRMTQKKVEIKKEEQYGNYVSLLPFSPVVTKITTTGMKYPLLEEDLPWFLARGVSNEIVDHVATIKFDTGVLLVIESKD